jgi:hypothetical protein
MLSKALEIGVCFHRGPVLGNMGGRSFLRAFERRVKFSFYQENFYQELGETSLRRFWKLAPLLHKAPRWRTWKRFIFRDF